MVIFLLGALDDFDKTAAPPAPEPAAASSSANSGAEKVSMQYSVSYRIRSVLWDKPCGVLKNICQYSSVLREKRFSSVA